jgi:hypothetical protein
MGARLLHEAEHEVLSPDANAIAVDELLRAFDELAIHSNSVAAVEVFQGHVICVKKDASVAARDEGVFDRDLALIAPSYVRRPASQIDLLKVKS